MKIVEKINSIFGEKIVSENEHFNESFKTIINEINNLSSDKQNELLLVLIFFALDKRMNFNYTSDY